jgi:hypothetical protein
MPTWLGPVAKSMLLCTDVLPGPAGSGNVHLLNVFDSIRPGDNSSYPHRASPFCVFLELIDAEGDAAGQILIRHAGTEDVIHATSEHIIHFRDRLQRKWVFFRILGCVFPEPGVYFIEFHLEGRWIAERVVELRG